MSIKFVTVLGGTAVLASSLGACSGADPTRSTGAADTPGTPATSAVAPSTDVGSGPPTTATDPAPSSSMPGHATGTMTPGPTSSPTPLKVITAGDYAEELINAWIKGDKRLATRFASPSAVDSLFRVPASADMIRTTCMGSKVVECAFTDDKTDLVIHVDRARQRAKKPAVVKVVSRP